MRPRFYKDFLYYAEERHLQTACQANKAPSVRWETKLVILQHRLPWPATDWLGMNWPHWWNLAPVYGKDSGWLICMGGSDCRICIKVVIVGYFMKCDCRICERKVVIGFTWKTVLVRFYLFFFYFFFSLFSCSWFWRILFMQLSLVFLIFLSFTDF